MQMLEATLDLVDAGVAVLDEQARVMFWNTAAATLTGHASQDVILRPCPEGLYRLTELHSDGMDLPRQTRQPDAAVDTASMPRKSAHRTALLEYPPMSPDKNASPPCAIVVSLIHRLGHSVPAMLRQVPLQNSCGEPIGTALFFYPIEELDALPHGEMGEGADVERSQADMEDRLDAAHHQWLTARMPFGLLWITVDQAHELRKTHGRDACEAMLRTVEQTLLRQMKPAEIIGRWGNNEFLVLTHERTMELLLEHGRRLAGLARTADFRWWGDRVGITVSIGASHVIEGDTLQSLLNRARHAMQTSVYAGGNRLSEARERE
jgi:diguanylate cyclase (GGDEF)-like protein